ncbi:substrate-binding periplasmic protein [Butyrivibrio sp. AC2005]|uniref:substrate-binding periplasmic protein n=1 Tax=Butyrivibrio sp. AC2005 TaxID=1280672 RepID=UPI0004091959|nr:transporter substrate-binding domain-containing protein [Butyrivibrio sp. AC2005]
MSNDFASLMMEGNETLRDEFSNAINDMKEDGTLDKLISEQIDALINRSEVKPVTMPTIDSADTIKVAVTGALPPMDYVAADGTPAGFNTAVLAEISQRIGKNIELVVVDSIGRATALSSGTVDAVFWTRTNEMASKSKEVSDDERSSKIPEVESKMSDEEVEAFHNVRELFNFSEYSTVDMPEGTICTVPYYSDTIVLVVRAKIN